MPKVRSVTAGLWATTGNASVGEGQETTFQSPLFVLLGKQVFMYITALCCTSLCNRHFHTCCEIFSQLRHSLTRVRSERFNGSNRINSAGKQEHFRILHPPLFHGFDNYPRGERFECHHVRIVASNCNVIKYRRVGVCNKTTENTLSR